MNEYIERESAEKSESICRSCFHSYVCEQFNEHRDSDNEVCHFFNSHFVPTADVVEVRHGEWADGVWRKKCSLCGFGGSLYDTPANPWNYCPNCGAKMN